MLQTVLAFVIPTIVTLSAAFYIFRQAQKNEEQERPSTSRYPRNDNNNSGGGRYSSSTSSRRRLQNAPHDSECVVCYDNKPLVELYPCGHKHFCSDCIDKIVSQSKRLCPYCRSTIKGYADALL